jgi:hypothetical protein
MSAYADHPDGADVPTPWRIDELWLPFRPGGRLFNWRTRWLFGTRLTRLTDDQFVGGNLGPMKIVAAIPIGVVAAYVMDEILFGGENTVILPVSCVMPLALASRAVGLSRVAGDLLCENYKFTTKRLPGAKRHAVRFLQG